jgi:hypothetical protein
MTVAVLAGSVVVGLNAVPAWAAGGNSIATAPSVLPGIQYSGDTSIDATGAWPSSIPCNNPGPLEYWDLSLIQGDAVLVQGTTNAPATKFQVSVLPPGTNDENIDSAQKVITGDFSTGTRFTVNSSGTYPMAVGDCWGTPGPYSFTMSVKHVALLYVSNVIRTGTKGSLSVYVRYPGGSSISDPGLTVYLYGRWRDFPPVPPTSHVIAHGVPVNGTVQLSFKLPQMLAGKRTPLIITAAGSAYQAVHAVTCTDIVAKSRSSAK